MTLDGQLNITSGAGNTIILTNAGGGFGTFDLGDIILTARGVAIGGIDRTTANIAYISAYNPNLGGNPNCCKEMPRDKRLFTDKLIGYSRACHFLGNRKVYLDSNINGVFDTGEQILEGFVLNTLP